MRTKVTRQYATEKLEKVAKSFQQRLTYACIKEYLLLINIQRLNGYQIFNDSSAELWKEPKTPPLLSACFNAVVLQVEKQKAGLQGVVPAELRAG